MACQPPATSDDSFTNFYSPQNASFYAANIYRPLEASKQEIRLLLVEPGQWTDAIKCRLIQKISLLTRKEVLERWEGQKGREIIEKMQKDASNVQCILRGQYAKVEWESDNVLLPYEALSYCAGNYQDTERIKVENRDFNAFRNLADAMRRLRKEGIPLVWIDQVCIDQSNPSERGHQVAMMSTVYKRAKCVYGWLGKDLEDRANLAIQFHNDMSSLYLESKASMAEREGEITSDSFDPLAIDQSGRWLLSYVESQSRFKNWVELITTESSDEVMALRSWYRYEFWLRCWIFQEITLPSKVQFLAGISSVVSRETLLLSQFMLGEIIQAAVQPHNLKLKDLQGFFDAVLPPVSYESLYILMLAFKSTVMSVSLEQALEHSSHALSSDPRDKVYGVMALLDSPYNIVPDYCPTNTGSMVFIQATKAIIARNRDLSILGIYSRSKLARPAHLPSWTPNLTYPIRLKPMTVKVQELTGLAPRLNCNLGAIPRFLPNKHGIPDAVLECGVLRLGTVDSTMDPTERALRISSIINNSDPVSELTMAMQSALSETEYIPTRQVMDHAIMDCFLRIQPTGRAGTEVSMEQRVLQGRIALSELWEDEWTFFTHVGTTSGGIQYIGFGTPDLKVGDCIVLPLPSKYPVVLRSLPTGSGLDYVLVGPAYLHGLDVVEKIKEVLDGVEVPGRQQIRIH